MRLLDLTLIDSPLIAFASSGHYTTCAKRTPPREEPQDGDGGDSKSDKDAVTAPDEEEQWMFFDDRVGMKKDVAYVTDSERNQRNCYMALYERK